MATASSFSYAQAAKGHGSNAPSSTTSQTQDPLPSSTGQQTTPPVGKSLDSSDVVRNSETSSVALDLHDTVSNNGTEPDAQPESIRGGARDGARDDETGRLGRPWRQNDKGTRSSSATTRSVDEQDSRRQRKSKKTTKSSDNISSEQEADKEQDVAQELPKVELSEAPIPSVNIWQQRKEAQQAKAKPSATSTADQVASDPPNGVLAAKPSEDVLPATSPRDQATNGAKTPQRRPADAARPERNASRGSRVAEREARESKADTPPSVADAAAWPTPETATKEEKRKPLDKTERSEKDAAEDGAQSKPRQKEKWVAYDYVPTVNFETQLPQMRNSKTRGPLRAPNPRSANASSGEKTTASTPQAKSDESKDRPRESSSGASRATVSPPTSKRIPEATHTREQKKPTAAVADKPKEFAPGSSNEQYHPIRERPEGRGERGRGGFRGRSGQHHAVNSHPQQLVGSMYAGAGPIPPRVQGPYSPPIRQVGHGQMYNPHRGGGRGGRGANNYHRMSLPNGAQRAQMQAQYRTYEYPMTMSAMPFQPQVQPQPQPPSQPQPQPYWDNMLVPVLRNQIEYYFSIENLCKDMYLRARMDSQGFVPLHFIAAFKRVRELSADMGLIRAVCEMSTEIDFVIGEDEMDRVRRREGWEKFVLPFEDRDEFARSHGPVRPTFKNRQFPMPSQYSGMPSPYGMTSPPAYPVHVDTPFQQAPDESVANHSLNGYHNGNGIGHGVASQLSADVPDFSPSGSVPPGGQLNGFSVNGHDGLTKDVHNEPHSAQEMFQS